MKAQAPGADVLARATGRSSVAEALAWIADNHSLERGINLHELPRAIVLQVGSSAEAEGALRHIARVVAASDLDSVEVLFAPETIVSADRFCDTLSRLAVRCHGGTLAGITASAVVAAQRADPFTLETLCVVAGLSYGAMSFTHALPYLTAGCRGIRGPDEREASPAGARPDQSPQVTPDRRPVVEPEGGEHHHPRADQERASESVRPARLPSSAPNASISPDTSAAPSRNARTTTLMERRKALKPRSLFKMSLGNNTRTYKGGVYRQPPGPLRQEVSPAQLLTRYCSPHLNPSRQKTLLGLTFA
jgi:hypothetical protein